MKNSRAKKVIIAVVCMLAFSASAALASNAVRTITVYYQDIKMYVDGQRITTSSEPFIYNGSTYLPVRAISEALGENVYWDQNSKSVYIGNNGQSEVNSNDLMKVCPPYQYESMYKYYPNESKSFTMAGVKYTSGFHDYYNAGNIYFNLNGKYNTLSATIGPVDGGDEGESGTISFEVDGRIVATYNIVGGEMPKYITVPLNGGNQLVVRMVDTWFLDLGVGNPTVK